MLAKRPSGQAAASRKYDLLTALGVHACGGSKFQQRLVLRFMTIITARYNWQRDELTMGRTEIARLWQVDERTVKRELAKLKLAGWITIKRAAVRGRVTVYGIDWNQVLDDTQGSWACVGPDFEMRIAEIRGGPAVSPEIPNVVTFPSKPDGNLEWDRALAHLLREDPAFSAHWLKPLRRLGLSGGILELEAPSAFHAQYLMSQAAPRLLRAVQMAAPQIHRVLVRPAAR